MKKHFLLKTCGLIFCLGLLASELATAQTAERRTSLGLIANALQYQGNFGSDYWKWNNNQYAPGIAINQYLTRGLDLNTQLLYAQLEGRRTPTRFFSNTLINANLGLKLKLNNGWALKEKAFFQPYLLVGSGWSFVSRIGRADTVRYDDYRSYVDLQAGAGISLRLGGGVSFFVQSSQHLPLRANLDGIPEPSTPQWSDRFLQHSAGLTFNLGQAPDADEDGVPDLQDKCPGTPTDIGVDERGCPLDDDQDGTPNYQDQCPEQAGKPELNGCSDLDNDGVGDAEDICPEEAGTAALQGCPDTDNDGVADKDDKCLDTPAGAAVDSTGCSAAPLPAAANPDTDGDGVANEEDRCPSSAGPATNRGCPELQADARKLLREATKQIGFELNKATLLPSSYATLDCLAQLLRDYPDYSLSIAGHTDSRGPAAYNLRLSRERAAAARRYLLEKDIPENRVEQRGYASRHPLATNATEAGRARNRRVEFDVFLTGDPNAAQVKYGNEPTAASGAAAAPGKKSTVKKAPGKKASGKKSGKKAPAKAKKKPAAKKGKTAATRRASAPKSTKRKAPAPRKAEPASSWW